jgi:hypothetical protein
MNPVAKPLYGSLNGSLPADRMPRGEHRKFREALRRVGDDRAKKYEREKKVLFHPADGSKAYYL